MRPLSKNLYRAVEHILIKKHGIEFAKIFVHWSSIVGSDLASICVPTLLDKRDQVLLIYLTDRSRSTELYFLQNAILMRIASVFSKLRLSGGVKKIIIKNNI